MISVMSGCTSPEQGAQQTTPNISLPGWVQVSFGINDQYIHNNKGHLDEVYDEYVGSLIDDGLSINRSHWVKPTYGNENFIWTLSATVGAKKIIALQKSKSMFEESGYKFLTGSIKAEGLNWNYSGYSIPPANSDVATFKSYIFVCDKNKGVSVFYWGNNSIDNPQDFNGVTHLLKSLSSKC